MVVASDVVAPEQFNFYLQSHDSALGTARSGHYVVFRNESKYAANKLHEVVSPHSKHYQLSLLHTFTQGLIKFRPTTSAQCPPEHCILSPSVLPLGMPISSAID